jgi:hypothetical protein
VPRTWSLSAALTLLIAPACSAPSTSAASGAGGTTASAGAATSGSSGASNGGAAGSSAAGNAAAPGGSGGTSGGQFTDGGAAGSAGLAGPGGGAGASGAAQSSCSGNGFLCDDFEQYPAASEPAGGWTVTKRGEGQIVVDTTRAFSGTKSLHVTGKMNADRANIAKPMETESPAVYFRFMMYATSYPASSGVHTRLMRIGTEEAASGNPYTSYSLAAYNGVAIERVNSIYLRDTGTKFNSSNLLNRWVCWEWSVDRSGGMGNVAVNIWVDGRELTLSAAGSSSHGQTSASWDPIDFKIFMLGLDGYQADPEPADLWIDDLSVTPERVGCPDAAVSRR